MVKRIYESDKNKRIGRKLRERFEDYDKQMLYDCVDELNSEFEMLNARDFDTEKVEKMNSTNGKIWLVTDTIHTDTYGEIVAKIYVEVYNGEIVNWAIYDIISNNDIVQAVNDAQHRPAMVDVLGYYNVSSLGDGMFEGIEDYLTSYGLLSYVNDDLIDELRAEIGDDYMPEYNGEGYYFDNV